MILGSQYNSYEKLQVNHLKFGTIELSRKIRGLFNILISVKKLLLRFLCGALFNRAPQRLCKESFLSQVVS